MVRECVVIGWVVRGRSEDLVRGGVVRARVASFEDVLTEGGSYPISTAPVPFSHAI